MEISEMVTMIDGLDGREGRMLLHLLARPAWPLEQGVLLLRDIKPTLPIPDDVEHSIDDPRFECELDASGLLDMVEACWPTMLCQSQ